MKRRIALLLALALSVVFVSLMSSDSAAQAQQQRRFHADTGMIMLAPNQVLRITVATSFDPNADRPTSIGIAQIDYVQTNCTAGTCKHAPVNPNPVAERYDVIIDFAVISKDMPQQPGSSGVRGIVFSNNRNVRATAMIINTVTGETTSQIIMANTEGDF